MANADIKAKFDKEFANKEIDDASWAAFADREDASIVDVLTGEEVKQLRMMIRDKNNGLSDSDKLILAALFNIPLTYELLGAKYGMTKMGAKKMVERTVRKLKGAVEDAGITPDDYEKMKTGSTGNGAVSADQASVE